MRVSVIFPLVLLKRQSAAVLVGTSLARTITIYELLVAYCRKKQTTKKKIKIMTINSFWPSTCMVVKMHLCLDYVVVALQILMLMQ